MSEPGKRRSERLPVEKVKVFKSASIQTSNYLTNIDSGSKPELIPLLPYHERLLRYRRARERIFCEELYLQHDHKSVRKRNTKRLRQFWGKIVSDRKIIRHSLDEIEKDLHDSRFFIRITLFGMDLVGLIDTGATVTCISGNAAKHFLREDIPYRILREHVTTAGGRKYNVVGYVETNVEYKG